MHSTGKKNFLLSPLTLIDIPLVKVDRPINSSIQLMS